MGTKKKRRLKLRAPFALIITAVLFAVMVTILAGAFSAKDDETASVRPLDVTPPAQTVNPSTPEPIEALSLSMATSAAPVTPKLCPITEAETIMLAKTLYAESQVLEWRGDAFGMSYTARQAAVAWCVLNRLDSSTWGDTLTDVLSAPYQFAYSPDTEVTDYMLALAEDVIARWWSEKQGETNVGRTLPAKYLFFHGDGRENYFRLNYEHDGLYWDWTLDDPYKS